MYELIVEEVKNKKLLNSLHSKWNSQDNSVTPEITEFIFSRFMGGTDNEGNRIKPLKDQLNSLKRPEIVSFLQKYNGENGRDKFEPNKLKDIGQYSFTQIRVRTNGLNHPKIYGLVTNLKYMMMEVGLEFINPKHREMRFLLDFTNLR